MAHHDTENYRFEFPDLPLKAMKYFSMSNAKRTERGIQFRSIQEFIETFQDDNTPERGIPQPGAVDTICQRLCSGGYLIYAGSGPGLNLGGLAHCYMSTGINDGIDERMLSQRLNFAVYGFPCIYDVFRPSVLPIVLQRRQIGTRLEPVS